MTPEEFKSAWEKKSGEPLSVFPISVFEGTGVSPQTQRFLSVAGLPEEGAAPYLSIGTSGTEVWKLSVRCGTLPPNSTSTG